MRNFFKIFIWNIIECCEIFWGRENCFDIVIFNFDFCLFLKKITKLEKEDPLCGVIAGRQRPLSCWMNFFLKIDHHTILVIPNFWIFDILKYFFRSFNNYPIFPTILRVFGAKKNFGRWLKIFLIVIGTFSCHHCVWRRFPFTLWFQPPSSPPSVLFKIKKTPQKSRFPHTYYSWFNGSLMGRCLYIMWVNLKGNKLFEPYRIFEFIQK